MKIRDVVREANEFSEQDPFVLYREARQQIREALNHMNAILATYYDRGPRYEHPDRDTLVRLARAASKVEAATHELAAGTPDDKKDAMDV